MSEKKLSSHTDIARDPSDERYTRRGTPSPLPERHPLNSGAMKDGLKHDYVFTSKAKANLKRAMTTDGDD